MTELFEVLTVDDIMKMKFPDTSRVEAALKAYAASDLEIPPHYNFKGAVHPCRGEALSPILWQGRQWAVTEYGIEELEGLYAIEKTRLWENEKAHGWVRQIFHKTWADPVDFSEALRIARHIHREACHAPA